MIGKGKAIAHGGNAIDYALREGKLDKIVGRNMIEGDIPADILREFEMVNQHNYRCKNKYMRYEIGISPQDIDKLKPEDMIKIARTFATKMGLQNHQWIACTHKDTGKPHIHLIANRVGVDGKVFDTTFMSNRSAKIAEEISREMGLTIANDVCKHKQHQEAYTDPVRQQTKEKLQQVAYYELFKNTSLEGFLHGLEKEGVGIEPAKNKQGKTYGIRFTYEGQTFKASEIGREFGFRSIAKNFSSSLEENNSQQLQQNHNFNTSNQQSHSGVSSGIASLLADLFTPNGHSPEEENNTLKKKKSKKRYYGRQF
ncbi:MAG: relaxase/mobilization nuclease domain-containing protein [Dysgonomonas sp.]